MEKVLQAVERAIDAVPVPRIIESAAAAVMPAGHQPPQRQHVQPGVEADMKPAPEYIKANYKGANKLAGKVALITGGDSGIGRAVAVAYAREGAKGIFIVYKGDGEEVDAKETVRLVEAEGARCVAHIADVRDPEACKQAVETAVREFGQLNILINNAAVQHYRHSVTDITPEQLHTTFATNIFAMFYLTQAALPHLKPGSAIINTTSVTAYAGAGMLLDYSSSKGCIVAFTRSLAQQLQGKGIRVNAVAPGPIWTPLIPATFSRVAQLSWDSTAPMKRPGQPSEVAPSYVLLGSEDGSFMSGQVLHPNGGIPVSS